MASGARWKPGRLSARRTCPRDSRCKAVESWRMSGLTALKRHWLPPGSTVGTRQRMDNQPLQLCGRVRITANRHRWRRSQIAALDREGTGEASRCTTYRSQQHGRSSTVSAALSYGCERQRTPATPESPVASWAERQSSRARTHSGIRCPACSDEEPARQTTPPLAPGKALPRGTFGARIDDVRTIVVHETSGFRHATAAPISSADTTIRVTNCAGPCRSSTSALKTASREFRETLVEIAALANERD